MIEYTTPTGKVTVEKLEEKQRSGQRLTVVERQILLAHAAKKRYIPETSTVGKLKESSTRIQQPIFEQIFPQELKEEEEIETLDKSQSTMAEDGGSRGPTAKQLRFVEDFAVDKQLVAEGIVVDIAENIVVDSVRDMTEKMVANIAEVGVE